MKSEEIDNEAFNFLNLCRTCMKRFEATTEGHFIFEQDGVSLQTKLESLTNISEDNLPVFICPDCSNLLNISWNFRKKCQEVDGVLKKMMRKHQESTINFTNDDHDYCNSSATKIETIEIKIDDEEKIDPLPMRRKLFICRLCSKRFLSRKSILAHNKKIHKSPRPYICEICHKTFVLWHELDIHKKVHNPREHRFCCEICGKSWFKSVSLKNHICVNSINRRYSCPVCKRAYDSFTYYIRHLSVHYRQKQYILNENPSREERLIFQRMRQYNRKLLECRAKGYQCDICNKKYASSSALHNHKEAHKERTHICHICGKAFFRSLYLQFHMRVHTNERPFQCELCNKGFKSRSSLNEHKKVHTPVRDQCCDYCGKSFTRKTTLIKHMRLHTGERPFKCVVCTKSFVESGALFRHLQVHYDKNKETTRELLNNEELANRLEEAVNKKFFCDECGIAVKNNSTLIKHKKLHIGDKPFVCDICEKRFTTKFKLHEHKARHATVSHICEICNVEYKSANAFSKHMKNIHHYS